MRGGSEGKGSGRGGKVGWRTGGGREEGRKGTKVCIFNGISGGHTASLKGNLSFKFKFKFNLFSTKQAITMCNLL